MNSLIKFSFLLNLSAVDDPIRQGVPTAQGYLGISNVEGVGGVGGVELLYWCGLRQCHH